MSRLHRYAKLHFEGALEEIFSRKACENRQEEEILDPGGNLLRSMQPHSVVAYGEASAQGFWARRRNCHGEPGRSRVARENAPAALRQPPSARGATARMLYRSSTENALAAHYRILRKLARQKGDRGFWPGT